MDEIDILKCYMVFLPFTQLDLCLLAHSFWNGSTVLPTVEQLERWVTIFLPDRNCVLVWLCCPSSDECPRCWRAQSDRQDGTNYSLPDTARDHHLHISMVTIMTSQGPMGGVGMLWYGALESLWQHNLDEHIGLTFAPDKQGFSEGSKVKYIPLWCWFHLCSTGWKPHISYHREMGGWAQDPRQQTLISSKQEHWLENISIFFLRPHKFTFLVVHCANPLVVL